MASLTTVYIVSLVLASLSGIGSAFAGHSFYQWSEGEPVVSPKEEPVVSKEEKEVKQEEDLKTLLERETQNSTVAHAIFDFIETPVMEWKTIAPTFRDLVKKYNDSMAHPDKNKCTPKLLKVCNMVAVKFSRMRDFIQTETPDSLGDQTSEALKLLRNTE